MVVPFFSPLAGEELMETRWTSPSNQYTMYLLSTRWRGINGNCTIPKIGARFLITSLHSLERN